jgi:Domain of unknown function (DUF4279)
VASNKGRAFFALSGYHFNPDDITRIIGVEPTSTNNNGMMGSPEKPSISSWEISTETVIEDTEVVDVYKLTEIILKKLEPIKEEILQVCKSHNLSPRVCVELTLSIDKGDTCPDVGYGARMVKFLADIGAFINIDYKLSERI